MSTPISSRIVLLENGRVVGEQSGVSNREFSITEKGVLSRRVYLPQLPGSVSAQPWIISNPIYVR